MASTFLSDTELYYAPQGGAGGDEIMLSEEESTHIIRVMRHREGDSIYVTDGQGHIFLSQITGISRHSVKAVKQECIAYRNKLSNIHFCIPKLKSADRFEFALEKSVELGITEFIVYDAEKSLVKGNKTDRWQKIVISAMKQSLRSYLPRLSVIGSLKNVKQLEGVKVVLDQKATVNISQIHISPSINYYFIFGPEAGLSLQEINLFSGHEAYSLTPNRLRAETAITTTASVLALK